MGVYIKGMEMPKSCYLCPFCDYVSARCDAVKGTPYTPTSRYEVRADWCPLVPVPEHGDLIERKAAYDSLLNGMVMTGYQSRALDCIAEYIVPTILPAEEGK